MFVVNTTLLREAVFIRLFGEGIDYDYEIFSEEALFKLIRMGDEISSFDHLLSNQYSDRVYLTVLREINGFTTSEVSQSIMGVRRFNYRHCWRNLKQFSLDRYFAGILASDLNLEVATFCDLIVDSQINKNISSLLEQTFGVSELNLKIITGARNPSLGAEGTGIRLAYNNIMRLFLGEKRLNLLRREVALSGRKLQLKTIDQFDNQRKFCPYTKIEQTRFHELQLAQSEKFIQRFSGPWMDEVFTPVIREKAIALVSEFDSSDRKLAVAVLENQVKETLDKLALKSKPPSSPQIRKTVKFFLKNEKRLVL